MYDIINQIIDHAYSSGYSEQQYIYYACCALIVVFAVVFVDIIRDIFLGFFRG